ncbi:MAG: adenylate kinase [Clostridiales bacterium]|nr:adenylate kinase [Clostridiales bacterium]
MKLIMLGPPGAGKGTQAAKLSVSLNVPTLSTGHILRTAIKEGLPVGLQAKEYMDAGKLVPDEIVIGVVKDFLSKDEFKTGYILDGVPRTLVQAEILEKMGVELDAAVSIEISDEEIEHRMQGRRVCNKCGASYNIDANPPKVENICDVCGEKLVIRDDDKPETVRQRLAVYHAETEPIIGFYKERGKLLPVDGTASVEETTEKVMKALEMIK